MSDKLDILMKDALSATITPSPDLNRQILAKAKENNWMKKNKIKKSIATAACIGLAAVSSVSAYAAYRYLSPSQVAEEIANNGALAKAFESEDAIVVNETQSTNGYDVTLLGLVSGEYLDICVPEDIAMNLQQSHTYAAVAIAKSDGTEMEYRDFCISPLINGVSFSVANNATLNTTLTFFEQDGIIYNLIECDNLEMFANRGVQLGVVDSFGSETRAFMMNKETGVYEKQTDYEKTNALFTLPLDKEKADEAKGEKYLAELESKAEEEDDIDAEADEELQKLAEFVSTITPENIDNYFERDDKTELTATPDENGWLEFGSYYDGKNDCVVEGSSGYQKYMMEDGQDFAIRGYGYGTEDLSDLELNTIWRNKDGSYTSVNYKAKVDLLFILE